MFLGHKAYEDLKNLIGEEATIILAKNFNGTYLYLPKIQGIEQLPNTSTQQPQGPEAMPPSEGDQGQQDGEGRS